MAADLEATMPPTAPLPTFGSQPAGMMPSSSVSAPAPISGPVQSTSATVSGPILVSPSNPSLPSGEVSAIPDPYSNKKSRTPLVLAALFLFGVVAAYFLFFNHRTVAVTDSAQPTPSTSVVAKDSTPQDTASAQATTTASQAAATTTKSQGNAGHGHVPYVAKPATSATAATTSAPSHPTLDIQMER